MCPKAWNYGQLKIHFETTTAVAHNPTPKTIYTSYINYNIHNNNNSLSITESAAGKYSDRAHRRFPIR